MVYCFLSKENPINRICLCCDCITECSYTSIMSYFYFDSHFHGYCCSKIVLTNFKSYRNKAIQ